MHDIPTEVLCELFRQAKRAEKRAQDERRDIEDELARRFDMQPSFEGIHNFEAGPFAIKIVGRMTRKIDADLVQQLAAEHGLSEHLSALFRWKPEIVIAAWKHAAPSITDPLLPAITTTPGRFSFSIEHKE